MSTPNDALIDQLAVSIRDSAEQYVRDQTSALDRKVQFIAVLLGVLVMVAHTTDFSSIASTILHPSSTSIALALGAAALAPWSSVLCAIAGIGTGLLLSLAIVLLLAGDFRADWRENYHISKLRIDPVVASVALAPLMLFYLYLLPSQFNTYLRIDDQGLIVSRPGGTGEERHDWSTVAQVKLARLSNRTVYRIYFTEGEALTVYRPGWLRVKVNSAMFQISQKSQCPIRTVGSYG